MEYIKLLIGILLLITIYNSMRKRCLMTEKNIIQKLVRQAARWTTAARQDKNSMIAVLHANYGAGYLWALKDIATDNQIQDNAHINIKKFESDIISTQDAVTKNMARLCPKYAPKPTYLTAIGGEGV